MDNSKASTQPAQPTSAMLTPKTFRLKRSNIIVVYDEDFSTQDVISAQKASGKDSGLFALYLAQRIATFDGNKLTMGEIRERVLGRDYLQLVGEILSDDNAEQEEVGN